MGLQTLKKRVNLDTRWTIISIRWAVIIIVAALSLYNVEMTPRATGHLFCIVLVYALSNIVISFLPRRLFGLRFFDACVFLFDITLISYDRPPIFVPLLMIQTGTSGEWGNLRAAPRQAQAVCSPVRRAA